MCWLASGNYSDADICCKALYATCEEICFKMTADEWAEVVELQCTQEENRHLFVFACTACCNNWFECSHSRRHRCHVALSCFPKGYPLSHQLEVRDTEPHTVCRHQQTGMFIGRQHMWQRNWDTCMGYIYRLWHRERLRQSREAECPEAHEKDITYQETFSPVGQSWDVQPHITESTTIHLSYVCGC